MPRINLLPWREAQRKRQRQEFFLGIAAAIGTAALVALLGRVQMSAAIANQNERNAVIEAEIAELDKQIAEINGLENQKRRLIARMEIIETLQRSRPEIVHVFDEIVRVLPEGVYLTLLRQNGPRIEVRGVAQSSTRVSAFMRNIDNSQWLADPSLQIVETKGADQSRGAEFTLFANQRSQVPVDGEGAAEGGGPMNQLKAFFEQLRNLDPNDPGRWPLGVRLGTTVLLFILAAGAGYYWFVWKAKRPELLEARAKETELWATLETKAKKAANLQAYKDQLAEMEKSFGAMLRQLPNKTEVPNLLVDISQSGLAAGLEEKLFQPEGEIRKDFYAELPIRIRLTGGYHEMGAFASGIAALPRIVTLHDIEITPAGRGHSWCGRSSGRARAQRHGEDLPLPGRGRAAACWPAKAP